MKMTNAEKIRNMTDEELAKFLANYEMKIYSNAGFVLLEKEQYIKPMLKWLESESDA